MAKDEAAAWKRAAAEAAIDHVHAGMTVGLGTGSTAALFVDALAQRVRQGLDVVGVATSRDTARRAEMGGVRLIDLPAEGVDLAVDGADEIDPALNLIKGGGGALLREKIVAASASAFLVIAEARKCVRALGAFALPIEIAPFGAPHVMARIARVLTDGDTSVAPRPRMAGQHPFETDNGGWIVDVDGARFDGAAVMDHALRAIPGVVETGLFLNMADMAIVADADGVRALTP